MAKKASTENLTEDELMKRPSKQSFVKIAKNKKENARTWVVIYRLIDGPPVEPKENKGKAKPKKKASA